MTLFNFILSNWCNKVTMKTTNRSYTFIHICNISVLGLYTVARGFFGVYINFSFCLSSLFFNIFRRFILLTPPFSFDLQAWVYETCRYGDRSCLSPKSHCPYSTIIFVYFLFIYSYLIIPMLIYWWFNCCLVRAFWDTGFMLVTHSSVVLYILMT